MLKSLPLIFSEQTFLGHQNIDWFGINYHELNIVATYNLIYNATFLVEKGVGYALCLDRLVNTVGRNLTFRPINPELPLSFILSRKSIRHFRLRLRCLWNDKGKY